MEPGISLVSTARMTARQRRAGQGDQARLFGAGEQVAWGQDGPLCGERPRWAVAREPARARATVWALTLTAVATAKSVCAGKPERVSAASRMWVRRCCIAVVASRRSRVCNRACSSGVKTKMCYRGIVGLCC